MNNTKLWKATDLRSARQARWLAKGWLPSAAVSILVGDEGIGKSLFWVNLVAAITTGKPLPELGIPTRDPRNVVLVITEDDWGTTVLPRLEVAGADMDYVSVLAANPNGGGAPEFPRDIELIDQVENPALVVVDTLLDTLGKGASLTGAQSARQALLPIKEMATRTGAAVLLMTHTNRARTKNARDKYGASSELRKAARMTLYAQRNQQGELTVGPEKSNVTALVKAARFSIQSVQHFDPSDDDPGTVGHLHYEGESEFTAGEQLAANIESDSATNDRQDRIEAVTWLRGYLEMEGVTKSAVAKEEAKKAGIALRTLQRARKDLNVEIGYVGQPPVSTWSLPE